MRIIHICDHHAHDNDDEGAIRFALEKLGHEVVPVHEKPRHREGVDLSRLEGDFALIHKLPLAAQELPLLRMPAAGWFFDLLQSDDPTLTRRSAVRVAWLQSVLPHCLAFFMTDGDAVARDGTGKLHHLMQGADERVVGPGLPPAPADDRRPPLLFAGMVRHGQDRARHIEELRWRYGDRLEVLGDGGPRSRKHGRELADYMAGRIVIAPDGPQTDRYHSNRIYQACGFGAFLLHPASGKAMEDYPLGGGVVYYFDHDHLNRLIDLYLEDPEARAAVACRGYERTLREHLYRHRLERLLAVVEEKLRG